MRLNVSFMLFFAILGAALTGTATADWTIDPDASTVNFVSVKNGLIVEPHRFGQVQGGVSNAGEARIIIDLASVDTLIPIRDERMRDLLFNVAEFPEASFSARIPLEQFRDLSPGQATTYALQGVLSLHGLTADLAVTVRVFRTSPDSILVSSERPLVINAASFALTGGLAALQEIAGLSSIAPMVPVSFSLLLRQTVD